MAMGDKGTLFVGNRNAEECLCGGQHVGGKREVKTVLKRPRLAERHRLQQGHAIRRRARSASRATTGSRPSSTTRRRRKVVVDNLDPQQRRALLEVPGHGAGRQALLTISARRATSSCPTTSQASITRVDPARACSRPWRRACATRSAWTSTRRPRTCGLPTTRATGSSDDSPNDTLHRVAAKSPVPNFGYPFCHQGDTARSRVRQEPLVRGVRQARAEARHPHRAARDEVLQRQDVSGRVPGQHLHRHARLVEPDRQAGLQRDACQGRRERQGERSRRRSSPAS